MKQNIRLFGQANATPPTVRYSSNFRRPTGSNLERRFCGRTNLSHSREMINSRLLPTLATGETATCSEDVTLQASIFTQHTRDVPHLSQQVTTV